MDSYLAVPFAEKNIIDFDVESTGLQPWNGTQRAFMYQFLDSDGLLEVLRPEDDWDRIQWWFDRTTNDPNGFIRAWNSNFDRSFSYVAGFKIPGDGKWLDGMIEAHAIDENRSVALKAVSDKLLGEGSSDLQKEVKAWMTKEQARRKKESIENGTEKQDVTYEDVPAELMEEYGAEDCILTRKIGDIYGPMVEQVESLRKIVSLEHDVMDALFHVQRRGMPVDEEGYRKLEIEIAENLEVMEDKIDKLVKEVGIEDFNSNSSKQIIDALKARKADMDHMTVKNDKISADAESLNTVDDDLARAILEFRSEYKAQHTYVSPYIKPSYVPSMRMHKQPFIAQDGRIHANFRQLGAKTGRMSCSDPNLQNQPRDDLRLRYNMRAEPGMKLVTCDLSNVEMRIFAAYAGEGALLNTINEGGDIHTLTAEMIGIRDRVRAGGYVESARQRGKTFNFSVVYGGGIRTIMKQQRCSQDDARRYLQRYKDAYPEVVRLQNRILYKLQDQGFISSLWGRRFRVDQRDSYKGVNYLVQGTAADLLKAALVRLHEEGVPVIGLVHDEVIAMVPEEDAEAVRDQIIVALTDHPQLTSKVPLEAEGDIIDRWSGAKDPTFVPKWAMNGVDLSEVAA